MISVNCILHTCDLSEIHRDWKFWQTPFSNTRLVSQKVIQFTAKKPFTLAYQFNRNKVQSSGKVSIITFCNTGVRVERFSTSTNLAVVSIQVFVGKFTHINLIFQLLWYSSYFCPRYMEDSWSLRSMFVDYQIVLVRT